MFFRSKHEAALDRIEIRITNLQRQLMTVSTEVQSLLDKARQLPNVVTAMNSAFAALSKQVADLQAQIAGMSGLSDDDKAALTEATTDIQDVIDAAPANIVQNTPVANDPAAGTAQGGAPSGSVSG